MKNAFVRALSRVLIVCLSAVSFQAQAGLIGTGDAAAAAQARVAIENQMQALGVEPQAARQRVAALSDAEARDLAARIDSLPAGGIAGLLPFIVMALLIYFLIVEPSTKEAAKEPAKK